ncbi:hypothetical protein GCM10009430_43400 [Aquimarina litoralis]|uniref:Peptidase S8/S53 domain-containing protein n=1 Tax=Aquimarina litoralis TaxID=584605 RepID=A0ABN1J7M6_9FLAO
MKKSIVTLKLICFSLLGIWGCSVDEDGMEEPLKDSNELFTKNSRVESMHPEIIPNQLVVKFKQDNLTEEEKFNIRNNFKNKYKIDIEHKETCDCDNDAIELWTINLSNSDFLKIENLVTNAEHNDDEGDVEIDLNFFFQIKNDPVFGSHYAKIEEKVVHNTTEDAINIAIIDTGIDYDFFPEPFLYNSSDSSSCTDEISGWDFVNGDNDPRDDNGHGTIVTKIITDQLDHYQVPYTIMAIKTFDNNGRGSYWANVCGLNHVAAKNKPFIVNTSFGFYKLSNQDIFKDIVEDASDRLLLISSAGNLGIDTDIPGNEHFPSGYDSPNILTVGGYTKGEYFTYPIHGNPYVSGLLKAPNSNYGVSTIDALAIFDEHRFKLINASNPSEVIPVDVRGTSFANAEVTARAAKLQSDLHGNPFLLKRNTLDSGFKQYSLNGVIGGGRVIIRNLINSQNSGPVHN